MKKYRRFVQLSVILAVVAMAILNQYESAKVKYHSRPVIEASPVYSFIDKRIGDIDHKKRHAIATFAHGNLWSMNLGSLGISDPLAVASFVARSKKLYIPFIITGLIPILATMLLGRVFCGWICPMNLLFEINDAIKRALEKAGLKFFDVTVPDKVKYLLLAMGLLLGLATGADIFTQIYPPRVVSSEIYFGFSTSVTYAGLIFLGSLLFLELFFARRIWCRCFCPGGALYSLLSGRRIYRMTRDAEKCKSCGKCDAACPLAIEPSKGNFTMDCDGCASCVDSCEFGAMSAGFTGMKGRAEK